MADKYQSKIEGNQMVVIIPDGPAKGEYRGIFSKGEDGLIKIGNATINGKHVALKLKPAEMPLLMAAIEARQAARAAQIAREADHRTIDQQMAQAGFSTGSAVVDREYGFSGEEF